MTDGARPAVRAATHRDIPAIAAIMAANGEPMDWPDHPAVPGWPYLEHLVARARVVVADEHGVDGSGAGEVDRVGAGGDDGVAGFAGSIEVGRPAVRFLTDLFVDPARHERGAGTALLRAALDGAVERLTFSSADERALGLYLRAGMRPWWPLLYVSVPAGALGPDERGLEAIPATVEETAAWSRDWTGVDRSIDLAHYASLPEADGFAIRDDGVVVAAAWSRRERRRIDGRWLDLALIAPDADPVRATLAVLRAAAGHDRLIAPVPGPHPVMPAVLSLGGRIAGRDTFCATDPGLVDPVRILPNPGFL